MWKAAMWPSNIAGQTATTDCRQWQPTWFSDGDDPDRISDCHRPGEGQLGCQHQPAGGNVTGIAALTIELDPKRLGLLCEVVPAAPVIGALIDRNRSEADDQARALQAAAQTVAGKWSSSGSPPIANSIKPSRPLSSKSGRDRTKCECRPRRHYDCLRNGPGYKRRRGRPLSRLAQRAHQRRRRKAPSRRWNLLILQLFVPF